MATTPHVPKDLLDKYFIQMERDDAVDHPVAAIAIPVELSRLITDAMWRRRPR